MNLSYLKDGFRSPPNENQFKKEIANHERRNRRHDRRRGACVQEAEGCRTRPHQGAESWLANYDFIVARWRNRSRICTSISRCSARCAKELPPLDKAQGNGWKLASTATPSGDTKGKKMAKGSGCAPQDGRRAQGYALGSARQAREVDDARSGMEDSDGQVGGPMKRTV